MSKLSIAGLQYSPGRLMSTASIDRNPCVLVIETDENLAAKVSLDLESGYEPVVAQDVNSGLHQAAIPACVVTGRGIRTRMCTHLRSGGARVPMVVLIG